MKDKISSKSSPEDPQLGLKRKWQIALRRYVMEQNPSATYAPYFGLTTGDLRSWIEIQFKEGMEWSNFGKTWTFTQRVPASLFDLTNQEELSLCWHFINLTILSLKDPATTNALEAFGLKHFYEILWTKTGLTRCKDMVNKIERLEKEEDPTMLGLTKFIQEHRQKIEVLAGFDGEDFTRLNKGEELASLVLEKEIIKKYGS